MTLLQLNQKITYWKPAAVDGNGVTTWNAGVAIDARWANTSGIVVDERGRQHTVEIAFYSTTKVPLRSMFVVGDQNGVATPPNDARRVIQVIDNPSISDLKKHVG